MELNETGVKELDLRDGEVLARQARRVCSACLALLDEEVEEKTIRARDGTRCVVCGETCEGKDGHLVASAAAEACHRALAALIATKARIRRMLMDNVLVLPDWLRDRRRETVSAGGIVLPASSVPGDMDPVEATVIAAGPGWYDERIIHNEGQPGWKQAKASRKFIHSELRGGDRVLVDHAISGDIWPIENVEYRIIREGNVLGVLEEEGAAAE